MDPLQQFMPHGMCYMWRWDMLVLHVGSDLLIAMAYFSIPAAMLLLIRGRPDFPRPIFLLFVAFILLCGITHLVSIVVVWQPLYLVQGLFKLATGIVSVITAIALWPLIPKVIALPSMQELEQRNAEIDSLNKRLETRLNSLETLAGGISHGFNNMLMIIDGNVQLLQEGLSEEETQKRLDILANTSQRASTLCNKMLAYSGRGHFVLDEFEMVDKLEQLPIDVPSDITLSTNYQVDLPPVMASEMQFEQLIKMLVENAVEAIEDTGRQDGQLTISVFLANLSENDLHKTAFETQSRPGKFVMLEIADNGCGMSPENQQRIFEPYFTTRFTGRGLGMSAAQGIIRGHDASLFLSSEEGVGTTIGIAFPTIEAATELYREPVTARPECVLVVDDEEHILELASSYLTELGIKTYTAICAEDALQLAKDHADEIDAVVLDYLMPEMNGIELLDRLSQIITVDAYLTSGFSRGEIASPRNKRKLTGFIEKPFTRKNFAQIFRPKGDA